MWHESHGGFDVYELRADERVGTITASGFLPLLCGAPSAAEAERIHQELESKSFCSMHDGNRFSIPNYNFKGDHFDRKKYWRGPVWINTNWLLMQGLRRYGFDAKAESVRHDILELVHRFGFHEYFDPYQGTGYGTDNFSWTAALLIDAVFEGDPV